MPRRKPNQLQVLKDRVAGLEAGMQNVGTLSITYLPSGQVISAALTVGQDHARIISAKRALQGVINHLDDLLVLPTPTPMPGPPLQAPREPEPEPEQPEP